LSRHSFILQRDIADDGFFVAFQSVMNLKIIAGITNKYAGKA
jgi:hypothetical protein